MSVSTMRMSVSRPVTTLDLTACKSGERSDIPDPLGDLQRYTMDYVNERATGRRTHLLKVVSKQVQ